jgi:hypothetical protein
MGQYYKPLLITKRGKITVFNREVDGNYTMAKLLEHSWWYNEMVGTFCKMIYQKPHHVVWVGDYSNEANPVNGLTQEQMEFFHDKAWGDNDGIGMREDILLLDDKYLVNHTKKVYIDCSEYRRRNEGTGENEGWIIHPVPLLTCIGNGCGGGDYNYENEWFSEWKPGDWANDLISIEDSPPDNYQKTTAIFIEPHMIKNTAQKEAVL